MLDFPHELLITPLAVFQAIPLPSTAEAVSAPEIPRFRPSQSAAAQPYDHHSFRFRRWLVVEPSDQGSPAIPAATVRDRERLRTQPVERQCRDKSGSTRAAAPARARAWWGRRGGLRGPPLKLPAAVAPYAAFRGAA